MVLVSNRVQIGVEVDAEVWQRFRQDVQDRHGKVRGVLGDEVETALRERLGEEMMPEIKQLRDQLSRIERSVGAAATDGGTDTSGGSSYTHAPSRLDVTEKPPAPAATEKKVAYLAQEINDDHGGGFDEVHRSVLRDAVNDEYGFRRDTAKRYVERLIDHFDLYDHPMVDGLLVTQQRYQELYEEHKG